MGAGMPGLPAWLWVIERRAEVGEFAFPAATEAPGLSGDQGQDWARWQSCVSGWIPRLTQAGGRVRGATPVQRAVTLCPRTVGRLLIEFSSPMSMERVQRENPEVRAGGRYVPPDCQPRQRVAVLVPFRHREHHLKYWLHYLHPILRRQKVAYGIYIVNQVRAAHRAGQGAVLGAGVRLLVLPCQAGS